MTNATKSLPTVLSFQNVTAVVYADRTEWTKAGEVYATRPHNGQREMVRALRKAGYRRKRQSAPAQPLRSDAEGLSR